MQEDSTIYYYFFSMASAGSLVSLSSVVGSAKTPAQATNFSKTPERNTVSMPRHLRRWPHISTTVITKYHIYNLAQLSKVYLPLSPITIMVAT
jgi:hypothetical protein